MIKDQHSATPLRGVFNTLAQNGTNYLEKPAIILSGKGSDLSNYKGMKGKAKRKLITQNMIYGLVDASESRSSPEMKKSYWNTFHCQERIITANGRQYGKYCKNRFCTLCCPIRKAHIINRYMPTVQSWEEPQFVTLTVKAVPFYRLRDVMKSMIKEFHEIVETHRKRNQRGKGINLVGIKSLESNFNPKTKTYNPHFHCVVANKEMADILISEWLCRSKPGWCTRKAQKAEKVFNNFTALSEVIKYGSKIFTELDINIKGGAQIYVSALNNIFIAMKGLRIFERFGFNLPKISEDKYSTSSIVQQYCEWIFHFPSSDWLNLENGNCLTDYQPPLELTSLLDASIDIELE